MLEEKPTARVKRKSKDESLELLQDWVNLGLIKTAPIEVKAGQKLKVTCDFDKVTERTAISFLNSAQNGYYDGGVTVDPGQESVIFSSVVPPDETRSWLILRNPGFDGKTLLPFGVRLKSVSIDVEHSSKNQLLKPVDFLQDWVNLGLIKTAPIEVKAGQKLKVTCDFDKVTEQTAISFLNSAQNGYYDGGVTVDPGQESVTFSSIIPPDETRSWLILRNPGFDGKTPLPFGVRLKNVSIDVEHSSKNQLLKPVELPQDLPSLVSVLTSSRIEFEQELSSKENINSEMPLGTIGRKKLGLRFKEKAEKRLNYLTNEHSENRGEGPVSTDSLISLHMQSLMQKKKGLKTGEFTTPELAQALLARAGIPLTDVTVTPMKGGFVSGEVYMIEGYSEQGKKRERFFLKYLRQCMLVDKARCAGEVRNLQGIKKLLKERKLEEAGFSLILPIFEGRYFYKKKEKLFTILPAAKGRSLTNIVRSDIKKNSSVVFQAFYDVGLALGTFQSKNIIFPETFESIKQRYLEANTLVHGDFHSDNIFVKAKGRVSLIDIETLAYSFDENAKPTAPLVYDIFYFIQQAHRRFEKSDLGEMKKLKWKMYTNFIDGYIAGFSADQQKGLRAYLESCFHHADEVEFVDIFPKVMGHLVTWKKAPDDKYSKQIIGALCSHLSHL
ncbi:MAG: hypothetical protein HYX35_02085 [Proteobacteria bacterium]|nr:hypothetical protein [Pseudomonadota bacterium]